MNGIRTWHRMLAGLLLGIAAAAACADAGPPAPPSADTAAEPPLSQWLTQSVLMPPPELDMPPDLRQAVQEIGQRRLPPIDRWFAAHEAAQEGLPDDPGPQVRMLRTLAAYFNRLAIAVLTLPPAQKQQLIELRFGLSARAADCVGFQPAAPDWAGIAERWPHWTPAERARWLGLHDRLLGEFLQRVPARLEAPTGLEQALLPLLGRPDAPPDLRAAMRGAALDTARDCALVQWIWAQAGAWDDVARARAVDMLLWADARQVLPETLDLLSVQEGRPAPQADARHPLAGHFPRAGKALGLTGEVKVVVVLGADNKRLYSRVTERKIDAPWLFGDPPVAVEAIFDQESMTLALARPFDPAKVRTQPDGRRQVVFLIRWKLTD